MIEAVIVAALSLVGTLTGSFFANRKSTALITYRIDQLEKKVEKHNHLVESVYGLDKRCTILEERIKE